MKNNDKTWTQIHGKKHNSDLDVNSQDHLEFMNVWNILDEHLCAKYGMLMSKCKEDMDQTQIHGKKVLVQMYGMPLTI